jgi:NADH-quinone oxidoreductase subunit N
MLATLTLDLDVMLPELVVAGTALAVVLAEVLAPTRRRLAATAAVAALGLAVAAVLLFTRGTEGVALQLLDDGGTRLTGWVADGFSIAVRELTLVGAFLVVLLSLPYLGRVDRGHGEFYALLLFAVLGVLLVSGVSDLLTMFVCIELVTISSYVLAAFKRGDARATEAGLKYLVVGAVSSAILLLGIAFVYGAVGEVAFQSLTAAISTGSPSLLLITGLVLTVVGILFKVGAVPFHVWIPDVYQGAPSPVVAFLSTGSKLAGMVLLLRLGAVVFVPWLESGHGLLWVWVLGGLASLTLVFGLLGALPQRSFKRMLGYSSIGHAGYLLLGATAIAAGEPIAGEAAPGATAILYYLLAFFFTNLTAFTVIVLVSRATGGRHEASSYSGLAQRAPFLGAAMLLALLSLAGIPPLSGFFGKLLVLRSVVEGAMNGSLAGLYVLAFLGAAGVAVSLYFYMRWIREIYFEEPEPLAAPIPVGPWARTVLVVGIVAMLAMGIFMGPFYDWAASAARSLAAF